MTGSCRAPGPASKVLLHEISALPQWFYTLCRCEETHRGCAAGRVTWHASPPFSGQCGGKQVS